MSVAPSRKVMSTLMAGETAGSAQLIRLKLKLTFLKALMMVSGVTSISRVPDTRAQLASLT